MKLSIIIISFNSGKFLKKCLESIIESSLKANDYEVVIVDNDSQDSSLKDGLTVKVKNLHLIKNNENAGFARANNQGIKKSKGEFVLLLNPDTIVEKNTLEKMTEYMIKNPKVGVSTCNVLLTNGQIDDACHRGFPTPWNAFCYFSGIAKIFPNSSIFNGYHLGYRNLKVTHEIDSCVGAFMLIRRNTGESLGWLDEDYFWYGEDIDFCYRAKQRGWKVMFVPTVKIMHYKGISSGIKKHSSDISTADENTRKLAQNARFNVMRLFYQKHYINKYPKIIQALVFAGIGIKQKISV